MKQTTHTNLIDQQLLQSEAYKNFINSVDSEVSKKDYRMVIKYFMKFCYVESYEQLLQFELKKLEGIIRDYTIHLKEDRKLSANTVSNYVSIVAQFYQMNDVTLNWKKLAKFRGKKRVSVDDRPYSRHEIKQLLDSSDLRMKCIVLLMASAGLRRGAIPWLKVGDLTAIEKYQLNMISVYKKEEEHYITFCTPEGSRYIEQYLEWRQRLGEVLTNKSPLIRREFNTDSTTAIARPKALSTQGISWNIGEALDRSGLRAKSSGKRTEIMECHGLRKFFDTTMTRAGVDIFITEKLMGHSVGLKERYTKLSDEDLLEGNDRMRGYISAINDLTINEEFRLKTKVDELIQKKNEIELMENNHKEEIRAMREDMNQIMTLIQQNPKLAKVKPEVLVKKNS